MVAKDPRGARLLDKATVWCNLSYTMFEEQTKAPSVMCRVGLGQQVRRLSLDQSEAEKAATSQSRLSAAVPV